jgi:hypothetical protein
MNYRTPRVTLHPVLPQLVEAECRLDELVRAAEQERLARAMMGPRPLRRRVGRLLIAAGEALAGAPVRPVRPRGEVALG